MKILHRKNNSIGAFLNVSLITGPKGELAAKLQSNVPDVLIHDINLSENRDVMFSHRRPDIYRLH